MPKTLVNIITDDNPIPAYLFIKEKYESGDNLMYISANYTVDDLEELAKLFDVPQEHVEQIILGNAVDIKYEEIYKTVRRHLEDGVDYHVNLAGGTRYMALAVQQVFEKYHATFYYVQVTNNQIVSTIFDDSVNDGDDIISNIRYKMTIAEYLRVHGITHDIRDSAQASSSPYNNPQHTPLRSKEDVQKFFHLFSRNGFSGSDYKTMELLRQHYRGRKEIEINKVEQNSTKGKPSVPGLTDFLIHLLFVPEKTGFLSKQELDYLTGGWFEEYIYYLLKERIKPDDIALGVRIKRGETKHDNELDVVFTKNNKLFVIECKTGVETERLFNEIVYKACAIKEALLGVSCHSYIFSLKKDKDGSLSRIAKNMGVIFIDKDKLTTPNKRNQMISDMTQKILTS